MLFGEGLLMGRTQDQASWMSWRSFGSKGQCKHRKEAGPRRVPESMGCFLPMPHPSEKQRACGSLFPSRLMEPDGAGLFTGHMISQQCHDNRSQTWQKRQDLDPHKLEACKDGLLFKGEARRGQGHPSQMPCVIYPIGKSGRRGVFLTRAGKIGSGERALGRV